MGKLNGKQNRALDALLSGSTKGQAAVVAGVTPRTLSRWINEDVAFYDELSTQQRTAVYDTTRRLTTAMDKMVDVLLAVAEDEDEPASVRVRAALGWINAQIKLFDLTDVSRRLDELELKLEAQPK